MLWRSLHEASTAVTLSFRHVESSRFRHVNFRFANRHGLTVCERIGEGLDDNLASLQTRENLSVDAVIQPRGYYQSHAIDRLTVELDAQRPVQTALGKSGPKKSPWRRDARDSNGESSGNGRRYF